MNERGRDVRGGREEGEVRGVRGVMNGKTRHGKVGVIMSELW